jgi:hypothetical protein
MSDFTSSLQRTKPPQPAARRARRTAPHYRRLVWVTRAELSGQRKHTAPDPNESALNLKEGREHAPLDSCDERGAESIRFEPSPAKAFKAASFQGLWTK